MEPWIPPRKFQFWPGVFVDGPVLVFGWNMGKPENVCWRTFIGAVGPVVNSYLVNRFFNFRIVCNQRFQPLLATIPAPSRNVSNWLAANFLCCSRSPLGQKTSTSASDVEPSPK